MPISSCLGMNLSDFSHCKIPESEDSELSPRSVTSFIHWSVLTVLSQGSSAPRMVWHKSGTPSLTCSSQSDGSGRCSGCCETDLWTRRASLGLRRLHSTREGYWRIPISCCLSLTRHQASPLSLGCNLWFNIKTRQVPFSSGNTRVPGTLQMTWFLWANVSLTF